MRSGYVFVLIVGLLFTACGRPALKAPEKPADAETRKLVDDIRTVNRGLKTFKGIGKIRLSKNGRTHFAQRIAWVGSLPLKFRIEVLFSGQSLITVASDGRQLYYRNRQDDGHPYGQFRLTRANLEKILSIPIRPDDFMDIIAGRIPVYAHDTAAVSEDPDGAGRILALKKAGQGTIQKIYLHDKSAAVTQTEFFDAAGFLDYRVVFSGAKRSGEYRVPAALVISTDTGRRCQLDISVFQANVALAETLFSLPPP